MPMMPIMIFYVSINLSFVSFASSVVHGLLFDAVGILVASPIYMESLESIPKRRARTF
jgi:hypothetical protein